MSRRRGRVETPEYGAMVRRMVRSYAKRVGEADDVDLAEMVRLRDEVEVAIATAVRLQRHNYGRSWKDIGDALGMSRQAAQQKYGPPSPAELAANGLEAWTA